MAGRLRNIYYWTNRHIFSLLPDSLYHNLIGWLIFRRARSKYHWMDINNPRTFNEKLQWLKLHDEVELKSKLADKYDVRDWVASTIGEEHLIDLHPLNKDGDLYVTDASRIDWNILPDEFALKLTKGSGYNIICRNKNEIDGHRTIRQIKDWLKVENYYLSRERQYIGPNKVICEKLLKYNIKDYKFFCFNGEPKFLKVDFDRFNNHRANFYNINWEFLDIDEMCCRRDPNVHIEKPENFEEMVEIARKLSKDFYFVRVDLYQHENQIYFGEMTFFPGGGYNPYEPWEWQSRIGDMLIIDK